MKKYSHKPIVTLFLTKGMTLSAWQKHGILEREMAIYRELMRWFDVQVYTYGSPSEKQYESSYKRLTVLPIPYYRKNKSLINRWKLYKGIKKLKRSSVFKTNQIKGSEEARQYAEKYNIPLVTRCGYLHSVFTKQQVNDADTIAEATALEKKAFEEATLGITSNERDRQYVIDQYQLPADNIRCVPNYVDQEVFQNQSMEREVGQVLFVGRLEPQKNVPRLIDAFGRSEYAEKLVIIGQGSLEQQLKDQAATISDPTKKVEFISNVPNRDLADYYNRCAVFVLPSHYEGLPKTLLEAMSCGCACLGTNVEGIREVIDHQSDGLLVDISAESVAQGIDTLLQNEKMRIKLGLAAHDKIEKTYSLERVVQQEKQLLESVIARKK